jgi:hypothetical protein
LQSHDPIIIRIDAVRRNRPPDQSASTGSCSGHVTRWMFPNRMDADGREKKGADWLRQCSSKWQRSSTFGTNAPHLNIHLKTIELN